MPDISKISPDGGTTQYNVKDSNAQRKTLTTPIVVSGQSYTDLEEAVRAINNKPGGGGGSIGMDTVDTENVMLITTSEM